MKLLGISARTTSGFHPQANGQAERTNQTLRQYLRVYAKTSDDWPAGLMTAEMASITLLLRDEVQPVRAEHGLHPMSGPRHILGSQSQAAKVWYKQMMREWEHARLALQFVKDNEIGRANRRREETTFQVGDLVLVRVFHVNRT